MSPEEKTTSERVVRQNTPEQREGLILQKQQLRPSHILFLKKGNTSMNNLSPSRPPATARIWPLAAWCCRRRRTKRPCPVVLASRARTPAWCSTPTGGTSEIELSPGGSRTEPLCCGEKERGRGGVTKIARRMSFSKCGACIGRMVATLCRTVTVPHRRPAHLQGDHPCCYDRRSLPHDIVFGIPSQNDGSKGRTFHLAKSAGWAKAQKALTLSMFD